MGSMRLTMTRGCAAALFLLPACGEKPRPDYMPIADAQPRAAIFEPVLDIIKKLPANPPPVTKKFAPADAYIGRGSTPGTEPTPEEYLLIHAEDLTAPRYDSDAAVKVRISGTRLLNACADALAEVKAAQRKTVHKYTLLPCTKYKYAYVIRTTDYLQPQTRQASATTAGKTRTVVLNVVPGRVAGDVTIYSLSDGQIVGGFQFRAVSSREPGTEGGLADALDRDLVKQANDAIRAACCR